MISNTQPNNVSTNIDEYTIPELFTILDINNMNANKIEIIKKTNKYILQFGNENKPTMVKLFKDIQKKLIDFVTHDASTYDSDKNNRFLYPLFQEESTNKNQSSDWISGHAKQTDAIQSAKITDREQQVNLFQDSTHLPMNKKQIGVSNTTTVPFVQDVLNPTLKNTITRMINLDSQFRQTVAGSTDISTDYTLDLSEPLLNVLSLRLYAFEIPYMWYAIDSSKGNNFFWITLNSDGVEINPIKIEIESGNYTPDTFTTALTDSLNIFFTFIIDPVSINQANGKITLNLIDASYKIDNIDTIYSITDSTVITFFDPTNFDTTSNQKSVSETLGWLMGFRTLNVTVSLTGNVAVAILDLYGPKYLILVLDDFNQNHINNGLIGITETSTTLKMPSYFTPDMLYTCIEPTLVDPNLSAYEEELANDVNAGNLIVEKLNTNYKSIPQILPSAPRNLTQSQIYAINEIIKNNGKSTNFRSPAPTISNTFAIIPVKHGGLKIGDVYVESNGSLQDNKRTYFGPVNIDRMRIKLLDDKGNVLNLNGGDWTITIISENLYQY